MLVTRVPGSAAATTAAGDRRQALAAFLRDRRERLDPGECGFRHVGRRRTPGLRREEVAQRAGVSVTWYTWLEQGRRPRKAVPSADVLDGIATALRLDAPEREHLFLLADGRPPPPVDRRPSSLPPSVRHLVDGLGTLPALVRTSDTWDIVAWNRPAVAVFGDYAALAPADRNLVRLLFTKPASRQRTHDWARHARRTVAALRGSRARAARPAAVDRLAAELSDRDPDFARWWHDDHDVAPDAAGTKRFDHPTAGPVSLAYSGLTPDAAGGLTVTVFVPLTADDRAAVDHLTAAAADAPTRCDVSTATEPSGSAAGPPHLARPRRSRWALFLGTGYATVSPQRRRSAMSLDDLRQRATRLDKRNELARFRADFHVAAGQIYLDGNSLGLASAPAEAAVLRVLDTWKSQAIGGWTAAPAAVAVVHRAGRRPARPAGRRDARRNRRRQLHHRQPAPTAGHAVPAHAGAVQNPRRRPELPVQPVRDREPPAAPRPRPLEPRRRPQPRRVDGVRGRPHRRHDRRRRRWPCCRRSCSRAGSCWTCRGCRPRPDAAAS